MSNTTDKAAVTKALRTVGNATVHIGDAIIACMVHLSQHRDTGQINRLIAGLIDNDAMNDARDVITIAGAYGPFRVKTDKGADGKADPRTARLVFAKAKAGEAETWRVDFLRDEMSGDSGKGTFRSLANRLRGAKAKAPQSLSAAIASLIDRAAKAGYDELTAKHLANAKKAAEKFENTAQAAADAAKAPKADKKQAA